MRPDIYTVQAGELRHALTIFTPVETVDPTGSVSVDPEGPGFSVWGAILPDHSREFFDANKLNPEITGVIRIRYDSRVTPKHRVKLGARQWDILGVRDYEERRRVMLLLVRERPGDRL